MALVSFVIRIEKEVNEKLKKKARRSKIPNFSKNSLISMLLTDSVEDKKGVV